jgi:hypothetical protein
MTHLNTLFGFVIDGLDDACFAWPSDPTLPIHYEVYVAVGHLQGHHPRRNYPRSSITYKRVWNNNMDTVHTVLEHALMQQKS